MTVQAAVKMWSTQRLSEKATGQLTRSLTISETYQVVCDAVDTSIDVLGADALPQLRQRYDGLAQVRVTTRDPERISPVFYLVHVTWEGEAGPGQSGPQNQPPDVSWSNVESVELIDEDINGKAIATVNGEPIHGVTTKINDLRATIKRNYLTVNLAATHAYLRSVNSDTIVTAYGNFAPGTGRLTQFRTQEKTNQAVGGYVEVSATIDFRYPFRTTPERAWWARVRHEGFKVIDRFTGKVRGAIDPSTEQDSNSPVLLTPEGFHLPEGGDANWLEFQRYYPLPYSNLGLL